MLFIVLQMPHNILCSLNDLCRILEPLVPNWYPKIVLAIKKVFFVFFRYRLIRHNKGLQVLGMKWS